MLFYVCGTVYCVDQNAYFSQIHTKIIGEEEKEEEEKKTR